MRLVTTPGRVPLAGARRTVTSLALLGVPLEEVVVNRCPPDPSGGGAAAVAEVAALRAALPGVPVTCVPLLGEEPVGVAALAGVGEALTARADPLAARPEAPALRLERTPDGWALLQPLPFASAADVRVDRAGDDLVLTAGPLRRVLPLPSLLRRCDLVAAVVRDGELRMTFEPDPSLWPGGPGWGR